MSLPLPLQKDGPLHSICVDPVTSSIYIHQKFRAWTYTSYRETRQVELPLLLAIAESREHLILAHNP